MVSNLGCGEKCQGGLKCGAIGETKSLIRPKFMVDEASLQLIGLQSSGRQKLAAEVHNSTGKMLTLSGIKIFRV